MDLKFKNKKCDSFIGWISIIQMMFMLYILSFLSLFMILPTTFMLITLFQNFDKNVFFNVLSIWLAGIMLLATLHWFATHMPYKFEISKNFIILHALWPINKNKIPIKDTNFSIQHFEYQFKTIKILEMKFKNDPLPIKITTNQWIGQWDKLFNYIHRTENKSQETKTRKRKKTL